MNITIKELRKKIDKIDNKIMASISLRQKVIKNMARAKRIEGKRINDPQREKEITERLAKKFKLVDKKMIFDLYSVIFHYSKKEMRK